MKVEVISDTLEKVNPAANENKFYRRYRIPSLDLTVIQYGSQRHGRTGGQIKEFGHDDGSHRYDKKKREGYAEVPGLQFIRFEVDSYKYQDAVATKRLLAFLDGQLAAVVRGVTAPATSRPASKPTSPPDTTPVQPDQPSPDGDRLGTLADRLLDAITAAANDPNDALAVYAELNESFDWLEAEVGKLKSYRETLEMLVEEAL